MTDEYTLRFIEDYAIKALEDNPKMTNEEIHQAAQKFVEQHGEKYDEYLRSIGNKAKAEYGDEMNTLEGMKDQLKEEFIKALQKRGILPEDETDRGLQLLKDYIKATKINFTSIGGGYGGTKNENYVNIDFIQTYKFIKEYPEKDFSFFNMARLTVYHELAHRLSFFLGEPTKLFRGGKYISSEEEKFGQGVEQVIANCLGIKDEYTTYYKLKEEEINRFDRGRMVSILLELYIITYRLKISVLNQRLYNLLGIFGPDERNDRRIELYAHPYEEYEIKAIVKSAMEKIQPAS